MSEGTYYVARCCGRTFQGSCFSGRVFDPPYDTCSKCGGKLDWGRSDLGSARAAWQRVDPEDAGLSRREKGRRIDLGLEIVYARCRFGVPLTLDEIAAFCGCSNANILEIEQRALRRLRKMIEVRQLEER